MLDIFPAEFREPVWYILAGFILGFAVSTLWEWLYFRRYRVESVQERIVTSTTRSEVINSATTPVLQKSPEFEPAGAPGSYRSPTPFPNRERTQPVTQTVYRKTEKRTESETIEPASLDEDKLPEDTQVIESQTIETQRFDSETSSTGIFDTDDRDIDLEDFEDDFSDEKREQTEIDTKIDIDNATRIVKRTQSVEETFTKPESESQRGHSVTADIGSPPWQKSKTDVEETLSVEKSPAHEERRHESRVPRSRGYPDDLTKIRGIGEVYKRRLFAANIFTFHHVATSDIEVLRRATHAAPNANIDSWPSQAEALAQKYQRLNASYSGPLPDDLQQISGIGPFFAQTLYRSGICTFEQLADASIEELRSIFPPAVLGREIDLQQWLDVAHEEASKRN